VAEKDNSGHEPDISAVPGAMQSQGRSEVASRGLGPPGTAVPVTRGHDQNTAAGQNANRGGAQGEAKADGTRTLDRGIDTPDGATSAADDPTAEYDPVDGDDLATGSTLTDDDGNMDEAETDDDDDGELGDRTDANG